MCFFFLFPSMCIPLLAFTFGFNKRCFLCSRCSMEMWCLDDIGRDGWDWVGPPTGERAEKTQCSHDFSLSEKPVARKTRGSRLPLQDGKEDREAREREFGLSHVWAHERGLELPSNQHDNDNDNDNDTLREVPHRSSETWRSSIKRPSSPNSSQSWTSTEVR